MQVMGNGYVVQALAASQYTDKLGNRRRVVTFMLSYPRMIHQELLTHRVFSRNASSTRAIPVNRKIARVWNNPAMPVYWGANKRGMQASEELSPKRQIAAKTLWLLTSKLACGASWLLSKVGTHKQIAGRVLEPFERIDVIVTATDLDNWFALRDHDAAQPEIRQLALMMKTEVLRLRQNGLFEDLDEGDWHLPYVLEQEKTHHDIEQLVRISAARCARVSFSNHDNGEISIVKDLKLANMLAKEGHLSPFEHQVRPMPNAPGNLSGWMQARHDTKILNTTTDLTNSQH